ncbi:hypothetical protein DPMN_090173, partial [Dreissena polymorpha]
CGNRILKASANSLDPDETPQNVASHQDPNFYILNEPKQLVGNVVTLTFIKCNILNYKDAVMLPMFQSS